MARLSGRLLLQALPDGDGVVLLDESAGAEIVVPIDVLPYLIDAAQYLLRELGGVE